MSLEKSITQPSISIKKPSEIPEYVSIKRKIRLMMTARYIMPPYIILTDLDIPAVDVVATAICWLLGKKPIEMDEYTPERTKEITDPLRSVEASAVSDHIIVFIGMAGLMTFAKDLKLVQDDDNEYLLKKWQVVCTTANLQNMIEQKMSQNTYMIIIKYLVKWQAWIEPGTFLYKKFLDYALENNEKNILIESALTEVRKVWLNYGLQSALFMEVFVKTMSSFIMLPYIVFQQAEALKEALDELRKIYGDRFPFLRLYQVEGAEKLNYFLYPDLYYAAVYTCTQLKILNHTAKYIMTELRTTIPKIQIIKGPNSTLLSEQKRNEMTLKFLNMESRTCVLLGYKQQREEEDITLMLQLELSFYKSID